MNLDDLEKLLEKPATAVFVDHSFSRLQRFCHPDQFDYKSDKAVRAIALFQKLSAKHASLSVTVKIDSDTRAYEVSPMPLHKGDIADYFVTKDELLLKIARRETTNKLMKTEAKACAEIRDRCDAVGCSKLKPFIPNVLDKFLVRQRSRPKRACTVFEYDPELVSLANVLDKYPKGVGPRHVAWIFNRLLTTLAVTHDAGWIHGAILPRHWLIRPVNHGGVLIEWVHAVRKGDTIKTISKGYRDFYPPEVLTKMAVGFETDIFMAAKLMLHILGPEGTAQTVKLADFLRSLTVDNISARPDDAWSLYEEFGSLLKTIFGKRKFLPLEV